MIRQNLHTHSNFDDGKNTMEEMVLSALSAGLTSIGFSVHTPMPYDDGWDWAIAPEKLPAYMAEAQRLKEQYRGKIAVYCGAEWEMLSNIPLDEFDYVIGSLHYISINGLDYSVDAESYETARCLKEAFGGDAEAAAEVYFSKYADLAKCKEVDIVGHFDLLTKFDEKEHFYDAESPRFIAAAVEAMDALIAKDKIFEINTGAIARGYRTTPYPSLTLLRELFKRGGRITLSSDSHSVDTVAFKLNESAQLAFDCGFREYWQFDGSAFTPKPIEGA